MATEGEKPTKKELAKRLAALEREMARLHPGYSTGGGAPFAAATEIGGAPSAAATEIGGAPSAAATEIDCGMPELPPRQMDLDVSAEREELIRYVARKWVNGTVVHYYFFDTGAWGAGDDQKDIVREAFDIWKDVGVGLVFEEVKNIDQAEIRIGFLAGDGYWSYVGTDVLGIGQHERTMNFGSDLTQDSRRENVPVHEIGHTLGFPHEHQNPLAGIVWDEAAVLARFGGPPNNWDENKIRHNILRKIPRSQIEGSEWDRDSIMHYRFPAGLIDVPAQYQSQPLVPAPGLSARDTAQALKFYPPTSPAYPTLLPYQSAQLSLAPGEQANVTITPSATRDYTIQTFGFTDSVMVLFEDTGSTHVYVEGDDDSGWNRNARIQVRLYAGREYVLRVRLYYQWASGDMAVMFW